MAITDTLIFDEIKAPLIFNAIKLIDELSNANIPICGIDSQRRIIFSTTPSETQKTTTNKIIAMHTADKTINQQLDNINTIVDKRLLMALVELSQLGLKATPEWARNIITAAHTEISKVGENPT